MNRLEMRKQIDETEKEIRAVKEELSGLRLKESLTRGRVDTLEGNLGSLKKELKEEDFVTNLANYFEAMANGLRAGNVRVTETRYESGGHHDYPWRHGIHLQGHIPVQGISRGAFSELEIKLTEAILGSGRF